MRSGMTIEMAKSRLPVLAQRLTAIQPAESEGARELQIQTPSRFSLSTQPEDDGPITSIATLLMAMAGAVLLMPESGQHAARARYGAFKGDCRPVRGGRI